MIDKAEAEYGCIVVCLCCDNDGGSHKGRDLLVEKRPWLFTPPCCAHQVSSVSSLRNALTQYLDYQLGATRPSRLF